MSILITGATGTIGRPLVHQLSQLGAEVVAVSRRCFCAELPPDVRVVADTGDLAGVEAIFVNARALGDALPNLILRAREARVRRLVVLSAVNVDAPLQTQPSRLRGDRNTEAEAVVVESGLDWVALRCDVFAANTFGLIAPQLRWGDIVRGVSAGAAQAPVHERDVAEVAAMALTTDSLLGTRPVLTGPESLTLPDRVAVLAKVLGRPLRFELSSADQARAGMVAAGLPAAFADRYLQLQLAAPTAAEVSDDIARILGRPALTFQQWAKDHRRAFGAPVAA